MSALGPLRKRSSKKEAAAEPTPPVASSETMAPKKTQPRPVSIEQPAKDAKSGAATVSAGDRGIFTVIKSPLVTEKSSRDLVDRKYFFWVARSANKIQIRRAVEKVYSVKVEQVASMVVKGKLKRIRWNQPGKTTAWKKAIVTLKPGFEIKQT